jgi:endogenous inhibitor of DNA gyrase (YacG/DUF329 family)
MVKSVKTQETRSSGKENVSNMPSAKDRSVSRHKMRDCPTCGRGYKSDYFSKHARVCRKPSTLDTAKNKTKYCPNCQKEVTHGNFPRHYRTHLDYSHELQVAGRAVKGDYPQVYKLNEQRDEKYRAVRYNWKRDKVKISRDNYLIYGRKSWFGLEPWRLELLDNS